MLVIEFASLFVYEGGTCQVCEATFVELKLQSRDIAGSIAFRSSSVVCPDYLRLVASIKYPRYSHVGCDCPLTHCIPLLILTCKQCSAKVVDGTVHPATLLVAQSLLTALTL